MYLFVQINDENLCINMYLFVQINDENLCINTNLFVHIIGSDRFELVDG